LWAFAIHSKAHNRFLDQENLPPDTTKNDSIKLPYEFEGEKEFPFGEEEPRSPLYLNDPDNVKSSFEYDPETDEYIYKKNIGDLEYRSPSHLTREQYWNYKFERMIRDYWRQKASGMETEGDQGLIPQLKLGGETFNRIFGSNTIDIVPQGSAELIFGVNINEVEDPKLSEKYRKNTTFDFEEKIQMNVSGSIGDKIKLGINYDTEATFDFENQTKLEYSGNEDEILQEIEAGNVSLPLPGSLITGSQSLFGLKTKLRFGNLEVTSVFSQQKGKSKTINVQGGAQTKQFNINADEYDANRHFFLSHYFRKNYNRALQNLPIVRSNIEITKVEVWITNKTSNVENARNIIAFMDLGEGRINNTTNHIYAGSDVVGTLRSGYPRNQSNDLYQRLTNLPDARDISKTKAVLENEWDSFRSGEDFIKLENARKLNSNQYDLNRKLGYISLKSPLQNDEVLAVAFEYTTTTGTTNQVGEFSNQSVAAPQGLFVKLLKGTSFTPRFPNWHLMMRNVYSINAYQVNKEGFRMNILYQDDRTGNEINYIPENTEAVKDKMLIELLNLDNVNSQMDASPDGQFDFISGITIDPSNGKIIFPVVQPFGDYLKQQLDNDQLANQYAFEELYDSTLTVARQTAEKNKFKLKGEYQSSSSSEIPLNAMNIPKGSVVVTANGRKLEENVHYTVDYNLGRVKILDEGLLESNTPIQISLESQSTYSMQKKTLIGSHFNYTISEDFNLGATVMHLKERPLTQKVSIGNEPISNTIWGFNGSYRQEAPYLTRLVDKIPLLDTKEKSNITVNGEFAHLIPGHSKAIKKEGNAYIDDFEGSETAIDIKNPNAWVLASTPQGQNNLFPEASLNNDIRYGINRAKLAWYHIDPLFLRENSPSMPQHLRRNPDARSSHFVREIYEKELFPNKDNPNDYPASIQLLNLAFFPDEKGPYNYEYDNMGTAYSRGINENESLKDPQTRWGGIMRDITTTDFEEANVEYIEFWMMDPFVNNPNSNNTGKLYFNLGNISEDILKDSRKTFENGLPTSEEVDMVDTTSWGRVPLTQSLVNAFDNDPQTRKFQDVGLDGLRNEEEATFFSQYLDSLQQNLAPEVFEDRYGGNAEEIDISKDDYHYYRGSDYNNQKLSIIERYKKYNGLEGNSPTDQQSTEPYPTSGKATPDIEDINEDNTLDENENYYQYQVELDPNKLKVGQNYITDKITREVEFANGENSEVSWYQFKIPVREPDKKVGAIRDFKSIRFMRMFLRGFQDSVILRFAKMNLLRGEWRRYTESLNEASENLSSPEYNNGSLKISTVNIEENANKTPVNYVLPPGIDRVIDPTNPQLRQLNEQAIVYNIKDLEDGDARAAFKNVAMDIRQYRKIKMFIHAEALEDQILSDGDLRAFVRLGTDYRNNFYEYEIPLDVTLPGNYDNNSTSDREQVWKNEMVVELNSLPQLKLERNKMVNRDNNSVTMQDVYSVIQGKARMSIRGNPNLSDVRTIMVGIRNPDAQKNNLTENDDGMIKSGEIWFNEFRLSDFKENGGWAARGRVSTQMADFAMVNVSGNMSTPGYGNINQKVNERSKETLKQYDLSSNVDLGKFFPEKTGVKIPMYFGYSERKITPQYNPLNPDVKLDNALDAAESQSERNYLRNITEDYTQRKNLNFTNIRVNPKNQKKRQFYDISNFSLNYTYSETFMRNTNTEYNRIKDYKGGLVYNYSTRPKNIAPFRQVGGILNTQLFKIIKDFNFYLYPSSFTFKTDIQRHYNEMKYRNINNPNFEYTPSFDKNFVWNRMYNVQFDLTRSIKLNFQANNRARIDEPEGRVNKDKRPQHYETWKDSVWNNIRDFGRNTQYNHKFDASYRLPVNKLPMMDWINVSTRYNGTYNWEAGPLLEPENDSIELGNTIRNSNTKQINSQFNLTTLYNKVGFLKKINQKYQGGRSNKQVFKTVNYEEEGVQLKRDTPKEIRHNLMTEKVTVKVFDNNGRRINARTEVTSKRTAKIKIMRDLENATVKVQGKIEQKDSPFQIIAENIARVAMGVKNISLSVSQTQGSEMPGFLPTSQYMGMTKSNNTLAPGIPYILGLQDENFGELAFDNQWLTRDTMLNQPYNLTENLNINARASFEPFKGVRIDISGTRTFSENQRIFYDRSNPQSLEKNIQKQGSFSMSFLSIGTAFEDISSDNDYYSQAFEDLKANRALISQRLGRKKAKSEGGYNPSTGSQYSDGYGELSQKVLIPSFLSAYGRYTTSNAPLSRFPVIPFPNWRINITSLSKIDFIKSVAKTINISHSYRSTYSIGSFTNNVDFGNRYEIENSPTGNFIPKHEITAVSINEQFNPLINVDVTWKNNLTSRFQISKSRRVSLSFSNAQVTEALSEQYSFSVGYRFEDFDMIVNFGNNDETLENDLNIKGNVKIRDNLTILRKLEEDIDHQPTAGQRNIIIGASADYALSNRFNVRVFYDRNVNEPKISRSFPTSNTNFGFSLRFTLAE